VTRNEKSAKFLICKRIPCEIDLNSASDEKLWGEHERLSNDLESARTRISQGALSLEEMPSGGGSLLNLKVEIARRTLRRCVFCEWRCRVDRFQGTKKGACKLGGTSLVSTWFKHFGEEPPLVGSRGSGTIFFTSCTFRCVFCQNFDISQNATNGAPVDARNLALIIEDLRNDGALNINFVGGEPTPNLHTILEAMNLTRVNVPMLWNSNMFCSTEAMKLLSGVIDIWLPDFKWGNDKCAVRLSKIIRYFEVVSRNHKIAHENGDMIIRHLVMPNHVECCTKRILEWIAENCPRALVNIMGQYHPDNEVDDHPESFPDIARRPTRREMEEAYEYADELGIIYRPVS